EDSEIPTSVVVNDSLKSPPPSQFDAESVLPAPSVAGSADANFGTDEGLQTISLTSEDEALACEEEVFPDYEASVAQGSSITLERSRADKLKRSSLKKVDSLKKAFSRQSIEKKMTQIGTKIVPPERREKIKKSFTPNHPKSPTSRSSSFKVSPMTFNVKKVRDSGIYVQDGGEMAHVEIPALGSMDGEASMAEVHDLAEGLAGGAVGALQSFNAEVVVNGDSQSVEAVDLSFDRTASLAIPEQEEVDGEDAIEGEQEELEVLAIPHAPGLLVETQEEKRKRRLGARCAPQMEMTNTGKPDGYWRDLCIKYAQGQYRFSTGKRPGAKKWKKALESIDACPLQSHSASKDLFGRSLQCSCGFHKPADLSSGAGSSEAGVVETEGGRVRVGSEAGKGDTDAGGARSHTEAEAGRGDKEAGASVAGQEVQCYGCNQLVEAAHFSEHLSDHHAQETCDTCGAKEEADIVQLYTALHDMDKKHSSYTQKARKKGQTSGGPWRAPRRPSGSAPGQQAAERLYMTHGQAAQDPEHHRVTTASDTPRTAGGQQVQTALALVPVNNTTVSAWLLRRDKRKDRNMLLQGNVLPQQLYLAKDPLPSINTLPAAPVQHAHELLIKRLQCCELPPKLLTLNCQKCKITFWLKRKWTMET
ncbi:unnamed protein product, partial [Gadus morhua 'NCC']